MRPVFVVFCLSVAAQMPAAAPGRAETPAHRLIFFSGTDISSISAFSWAGAELMFGDGASGPVIRGMGGSGAYDYARLGAPDGYVRGTVMLGEAMAGWRRIAGDVCLTILGGIAVEDHELDVPDPENRVQDTATGPKIAVEVYWRPNDHMHVEGSATYAATFDFWRVRTAAGYDAGLATLGTEIEAFGNEGSHQMRFGLFASDLAWRKYVFKAALGALHDGSETGMYGRLSLDRKF